MSAGRLAKLWRRTWIGASMIAALAACLILVELAESPLPIALVSGSLLLVAVLEVDRMGTLAGRGLSLALLPAAIVAIAWSSDAAWMPAVEGLAPLWLGVLIAAMLGYTGHNLLLHARARGRALAGAIVAASAVIAFLVLNASVELGPLVLVVLALLSVCLAAWSAPRWAPRRPRRAMEILVVIGLSLWLVPPLPAIAEVWFRHGVPGLAALLILSKLGDIAGYYVGSSIGRRKIAPRISPGKTVEGCAGSLVAGVLGGFACVEGGWLPEGALGPATGPLLGAVTNILAQAGDLLESFVKRRAGVKDSGAWFGPAGGVLDVVDSLLLTVPVALFVWPLLLR